MQSHIRLDENKKLKKGETVIRVRSLTVKTLAKTFHIPHRFGILSIDAEGVGDKVIVMSSLDFHIHLLPLLVMLCYASMSPTMFTVKTLAKTFHIPHRFGILSIDAEGVGD